MILAFLYDPAVAPEVAKSSTIVPEETIGDPDTVSLDASVDTATLVTVPPPLPFPPVAEIVTAPLLPLIDTPVPAINSVTPVFVIVTVPVVELAVTSMPVLELKVLKLLALANSMSKLTLYLVNAVYRSSLPTDSLGKPILMFCFPVIAIYFVVPYIYYLSIKNNLASMVRTNSRIRMMFEPWDY